MTIRVSQKSPLRPYSKPRPLFTLKGTTKAVIEGGSTPVLVALLAYRRPVDHGAKQTWRRALNSLSARRFRQVGRSACSALGRRRHSEHRRNLPSLNDLKVSF